MAARPLVAIPARFSETASALRHRAIVSARALSEAVLLAGGEPLTIHPRAPGGELSPGQAGQRLAFADAVLLPGGGDLEPSRYGQQVASASVYDVDAEQDAFDLAVARWALSGGIPLLAICRGLQVVNVALGGTLDQHMPDPHRHLTHDVTVAAGSLLGQVMGNSPVRASCYHHQRIDRLAAALRPVAFAADGTVEAAELANGAGWFLGAQWHPEDTAGSDPRQLALIAALVTAARPRRSGLLGLLGHIPEQTR